MAFVNEKLTDKDKEYISSFKFHNPIGRLNELAPIPEEWSIDRENKYYLICLGGQGRLFDEEYPPNYYHLIIDNKSIEIEARFKCKGNYSTGVELLWKIQGIYVPHSLSYILPKKIINIVREAFICYGNVHKNGHVIKTEFDSIAEPFYLRC
ncbi:MAG: hypothetical protein ACI4JN_04165 [Ruminococcus sp.]